MSQLNLFILFITLFFWLGSVQVNGFEIALVRPGFITKYTVATNYTRPGIDFSAKFNLYLQDGENGGVEGIYIAIIRDLDFNVTLGRKVKPEDDPSQYIRNRIANRRFLLAYNGNGEAKLVFPGEFEDRLQGSFRDYWELISFDKQLIYDLRTGKASYQREIKSSISGIVQQCRVKFNTTANLDSYIVHSSFATNNCYRDSSVPPTQLPHSPKFQVEIVQELKKADLTLKSRRINFKTFDDKSRVERSGSTLISYVDMLLANEHMNVFQSRATPLSKNTVKLTNIIPFKPGYDTKYNITAFIKEKSISLSPQFDLYIREGGNPYYAFGSILNITHLNFYGTETAKSLFKEAFERIFVLGFNEDGRPVFKYLDEDGDDLFIAPNSVYSELLKYDLDTLQSLSESRLTTYNTSFNVNSVYIGEGCQARHTIKDLTDYYQTTIVADTAPDCGKGSNGTFFGLFGKRVPSDLSLRWSIEQTLFKQDLTLRTFMLKLDLFSVKTFEEIAMITIGASFDRFVPKSYTNQRTFFVYGEEVNESFFKFNEDEVVNK